MSATQSEAEAKAAWRLPPYPYPGLRPFEQQEWPIFFGRERMADDVSARLERDRLLVIHGDSGCGKSSLVYAGVLPRLEQEWARGGHLWTFAAATPGDSPLWNLARALSTLVPDDGGEERTLAMRRLLNFGADGANMLRQALGGDPDKHVVIVLDQFEELFVHARDSGPSDARLLIEFLMGVQQWRPNGVYVAVTMRSDSLGACAQFPKFAEAVNAAQYLLPRMDHADLLRAIREPATLYDGEITRDLAERLIAEVDDSQDQLPLIQHGLMVLHRRNAAAAPRGSRESVSDEGQPWKLGLEHYERVEGGLHALLSGHADDVARAAQPPPSRVVEDMFRALTEINAEGNAVRRPQKLGDLARVAGVDEATTKAVVDAFRAEGVSLLRPYGSAPLSSATPIDISHEALIRCWKSVADRKDGWLIREFKNGLVWRSLLVQAESFERDPKSVLSPATAIERSTWLQRRNEAWCERYGGGWQRVTRLIEASIKEVERQQEADLRARRKEADARVVRLGFVGVSLLVLVVVPLLMSLYHAQGAKLRALEQATDANHQAQAARDEAAVASQEALTAGEAAATASEEVLTAREALETSGSTLGAAASDAGLSREVLLQLQRQLLQQAASIPAPPHARTYRKGPASIAASQSRPLTDRIQPRASFRERPGVKSPAGKQVYAARVWIDAPPEVARRITKVEYFFDHPSFPRNTFTSRMPPDFNESYEAWGCIARVVLSVWFADGTAGQREFDECAAAGELSP